MLNRIEHRAFTKLYEKPVNKLITSAGILPILTLDNTVNSAPSNVKALWDTGATLTCLKPALFKRLKLRLFETTRQTPIAGIGGNVAADLTFVDIFLAYNLVITCCPVYIADFPGNAELLIGMDIIGMGDFAVCNAEGKTSFSFVMPPFPDRVNFAEKAEAANRSSAV